MKKTGQLLMILFALTFTKATFAQEVYQTKGDLSFLKDEKSINIEFSYENMIVDEYGKEDKFLKLKKDEKNAKEPGSGDKFLLDWEADKKEKYEPRFIQRFTEHSKLTVSKDAKYTLVFRTKFMSGGYSVGVAKKSAQIEAEVWIVESSNRAKKLVVFTVDRAEESMWRGAAFDNGDRISQAYMLAAKALGKYIKKEIK